MLNQQDQRLFSFKIKTIFQVLARSRRHFKLVYYLYVYYYISYHL